MSNTSINMVSFTEHSLRWLELLLEERFGHTFILSQESEGVILRLKEGPQFIRFDRLQKIFHQSRSDFPCYFWEASAESFNAPIEDTIAAPSETKLPIPLVLFSAQSATIQYDILGLIYWMLSRLEEVDRKDLDCHQRFPAISSHAYKNGYLERPIVDEWLVILGQVIKRVWPSIKLKTHEFSINVSHDVDSPSLYAFKSWGRIIRMMAGHLLKRHDIKAFFTAPYVKLVTGSQLHSLDPFNTFDWLMGMSEANNLRGSFYFICGRTDPALDADYEPDHTVIRELMRRIHQRGHEIGLHPSYSTFHQPELIKQEAVRLKRICSEENIVQDGWGGRMHYLRWQQPTTLRAWDEAGMNYDSTLGYADRPGFRCGTCYEYPAFDPVEQEQLNLRVRPLIVMECSVIDSAYLGLGMTVEAVDRVLLLKARCRKLTGSFNLLWHNSYFMTPELKEMYKKCLEN